MPRIIFMGGISRPGDRLHLLIIKLIISLSQRLESDKDTNKFLRVYFLPNYTTSKEYWYVPALDVNEQLCLPGKQACSTQPLKFIMNGSILLGSKDSTNQRIESLMGDGTTLLFGSDYYQQQTQ